VSKTRRQYKVRFKSNIASKRSKTCVGIALEDFDLDETFPEALPSPGDMIQSPQPEFWDPSHPEGMPADLNGDVLFDENSTASQDMNEMDFLGITSNTSSVEVVGSSDYSSRSPICPSISSASVWRNSESSRDDQRFYLQYCKLKVPAVLPRN